MAGGDGFRVPTAALTGHSREVDAVAGAVELARSAAAQVQLGRSAYGLLCQFMPTLLYPIQHLGIAALGDAVDALAQTAHGVRAASGQYDGGDACAVHRFGGSGH